MSSPSLSHETSSGLSRERLGLLLGFVGMAIFGGTLPATPIPVSAIDPPALVLPWLQLLHALSFGATHLGALMFLAHHAPAGQAATAQGYLAIGAGAAMAVAMGVSGLLFADFGSRAYAAMALAAFAGGACGLVADRLGRHPTR